MGVANQGAVIISSQHVHGSLITTVGEVQPHVFAERSNTVGFGDCLEQIANGRDVLVGEAVVVGYRDRATRHYRERSDSTAASSSAAIVAESGRSGTNR